MALLPSQTRTYSTAFKCFWLWKSTLFPAWVHSGQTISRSLHNTRPYLSWVFVDKMEQSWTWIWGMDFRRTDCLGQVEGVMAVGARYVQENRGGGIWTHFKAKMGRPNSWKKWMLADLRKRMQIGEKLHILAINYTEKSLAGKLWYFHRGIMVAIRKAKGCWHGAQTVSDWTAITIPVVLSPFVPYINGFTHRCSWRFSFLQDSRCVLPMEAPLSPMVWE